MALCGAAASTLQPEAFRVCHCHLHQHQLSRPRLVSRAYEAIQLQSSIGQCLRPDVAHFGIVPQIPKHRSLSPNAPSQRYSVITSEPSYCGASDTARQYSTAICLSICQALCTQHRWVRSFELWSRHVLLANGRTALPVFSVTQSSGPTTCRRLG